MNQLLSISAAVLAFICLPLHAQDRGDRLKISPPPAKIVQPSGVAVFDLFTILQTNPDARIFIDRIAVEGAQLHRSSNYLLVEGSKEATNTVAQELNAIRSEALDTVTLRLLLCEVPEEHALVSDTKSRHIDQENVDKLRKAIDAGTIKLLIEPTLALLRFQEGEISIADDTSQTTIEVIPGRGERISVGFTHRDQLEGTTFVTSWEEANISVADGLFAGLLAQPQDTRGQDEDTATPTGSRLVLLVEAKRTPTPLDELQLIRPSTIYASVPKTRDGIGKAFMGREIAQVMGHLGAGWLERPEREQEERTDLLVGMLPLNTDSVIADIGAGSGYFTSRLAPLVPQGSVLATDIQPEMLEILSRRIRKEGLGNVRTVLGTIDDTGLEPGSVDLILLVDVYHEFDHPWEMLTSMRRALKPGGFVALAEYRANDPLVPIKPLHTMSSEQVILEFELAGFTLQNIKTDLPWQRLFLFGVANDTKTNQRRP